MEKFEIETCSQWILTNKFNVVALQLPDDDLDKVHELIDALSSSVKTENMEFFLVGDGCSSCCNDLLNTQYCQAQGLIHFGHSCLVTSVPSDEQQQTSIPVFYVFYQQPLPADASTFLSMTNSEDDKAYCLVFYDPCFRDAIQSVSTLSTRIIVSKIGCSNTSNSSLFFSLYGRSVQLPVPLDPSAYSIVFISHSTASLHNFALYFYAYEFRSFPSSAIASSKLLSKRMYAIECARNGSSFGLLVSSNSLLNLSSTIHTLLDRIKSLLNLHQRQHYTLLMNTLSITKMNNFESTIDVYVLCSSCPESIWLSPQHKQFNIPLISMMDVVQAFDNEEIPSSLNYSFDLQQILASMKVIEGHTTENIEEKNALVVKHPNALLLQQHDGTSRHGGRSWWGLDMSANSKDEEEEGEGKRPVAELKEGKFGVAAGYANEKN